MRYRRGCLADTRQVNAYHCMQARVLNLAGLIATFEVKSSETRRKQNFKNVERLEQNLFDIGILGSSLNMFNHYTCIIK